MKTLLALAALLCAVPQDPAALIEKLRSKDADEAENARRDLLDAGPKALAAVRDAAGKEADAALKKTLIQVADRLETRQAAAGLAARWGDRWYSVQAGALRIGWAHLKTEEKDGKLLLTDELYVKPSKEGEEITVKATLTCAKDEFLTPVEIAVSAQNVDGFTGAFSATVKDGRIIAESGADKKAQRIRPNTVIDLAVLRLVTLLPRGAELDVDLLTVLKPKMHPDSAIKQDKEESIEYGGRLVKTRRFILSDGESDDRFYNVDADGRLLRMQGGNNIEIHLAADEKSAKEMDTK
jgi:hypothetical protein